jgi:hypothetical protein
MPSHVIVIHYSCEGFDDRPDGSSPRITSIAVRNLGSAQTQSFSIHQMAERRHLSRAQLEQHYDELEKSMLDDFYAYVRTHRDYTWLHWNMRDSKFGFQAIAHRYKVLGGDEPPEIPEDRLFDLPRYLHAIYGRHYAPHPRLESLTKLNKLDNHEFLNGQGESDAFDNKDYVKLHHSTLRKVDIFSVFAERAHDGSLETKADKKDIYGGYGEAIGEFLKENWTIVVLIQAIEILGFVLAIVSMFSFSGK